MSRYTIRVPAKNYLVMFGYDRPLNYVFLDIDDTSKDEEDAEVFGCLNLPNVFTINSMDGYKEVLNDLGIEIPQAMIEQVHMDRDEATKVY